MLGSVVVFGGVFVSPPLMGALARGGVTLVLLDRQGRFEARVEGPVSGNVLLRRAQYRATERPDDIARAHSWRRASPRSCSAATFTSCRPRPASSAPS
jgi:CRISPR-associated protein Cas1